MNAREVLEVMVRTDRGSMPDPDGVYDCCPTPQIETDSAPMAAYLVELLNADTGGAS